MSTPLPHGPRDADAGRPLSTRAKVLIAIGGSLALGGMLMTAVFNYLLAPPRRVLVVTMAQSAVQADRQQLKADCGSLPGIRTVADRGDPSVQDRFPVRFDIARASTQQEAALIACINQHPRTVRGYLSEGDR